MSEADAVLRAREPATAESLLRDLAALGVATGMTVLVHSSLSALGWVCGGAVAVIDALTRALGPEGTLVMPAFSADCSEPAYWTNPPVPEEWWPEIRASMPPFDPLLTPTRRVGRIPECFRTLPGVLRSAHPQVSFSARGPQALRLVGDHPLDFGLGPRSPLGVLYETGAHVLLLGVGHARNTSLHLAEHRWGRLREIEQGAPMRHGWTTFRDLDLRTDDFEAIGEAFGGRRGRVACAEARLFEQRAIVDFAVGWMERNRGAPGEPGDARPSGAYHRGAPEGMSVDITYEPDLDPPPRRFVPDGFNAAEPAALDGLAKELLERPVGNPAALEAWVLDWSDLSRAFHAVRQRRRIRMSRNTADAAAREAFLSFERDLVPRWQHLEDAFRRRYLESPFRAALPPRFAMFDRGLATAKELYRDANVPLFAEEEELSARYSQLVGRRTVSFRGRAMREQECGALLEEVDRETRRDAYQALVRARAADAEETESIFDTMLALRHRVACNAGCADYREFRFRDLLRYDYGPAQCAAFHDAVERHVVPALSARMEGRRRALGLDSLRPWDRLANPDRRSPTIAFADESGLVGLGRGIFRAVDPGFDEEFNILVRNGLLDLMARPGKAPGGYNAEVPDIRLPFIFANSVGRYSDVKTLLHEGGHAFHTLATRDEPVPELAHAPTEFCEVASMTMELFGLERFDGALPSDEARDAAIQLLEHRLWLFAWVATVDAFQHWLYTHPGHARAERRAAWVALRERFEPYVDYTGFEEARATDWHSQLHLFKYPFYYIEYGIAALGSLQVWQRYRRDPASAIGSYRAALALGGSRPLPELFATAGARFAMDGPAVAEAVEGVVARLADFE